MIEAAFTERGRWCWWHWQNLNDKRDGTQGSGLRHGRCWWHFRSGDNRPDPDICLEWSWLTWFFGFTLDIDDEDLTVGFGCLLFAVFLSFSTGFRWISRIAPRERLSAPYQETVVISRKELSFRVHGGAVWMKFWGPRDAWSRDDPWWKRGVSFDVNPFRWVHQRHDVRCAGNVWEPFVGGWERDKAPDRREVFQFPYTYVLKRGVVQNRVATVFVDRMEWRPWCLQWTGMFAKVRESIDVAFDEEVGERTGSWKGGTVGCGWELRKGESPEQALRRMERERVFD